MVSLGRSDLYDAAFAITEPHTGGEESSHNSSALDNTKSNAPGYGEGILDQA